MEERETNGRFPKGRSGNPGGRPRKLREVDAVLEEHRSAEGMREAFSRLREMAFAGEAGAMKLYLDRVLGPVREVGYVLTQDDIEDAPDAVVRWFADLGNR